jgi:hypothetical protein
MSSLKFRELEPDGANGEFTFTKNRYKRQAFWSLFFHFLRARPQILYALFSQFVMHAHIYDMVLENYGPPEEAFPDVPFHD